MATLRSKEFSCSIPDVTFTASDRAYVTVSIDGTQIYAEWLYPSGGIVTLQDLSELATPYARQRQTVTMAVKAVDEGGGQLLDSSTEVVYCQADFCDETATCTGTHRVAPSYKRSMAYVGRMQRNHNVVQLLRAGRIFDNTFDNTFN